VNTTSHLERLNKTFGTRLCVSEDTRARCPNIAFREIASVVLKGKTMPTVVWEPLHPDRGKPELIERYRAAFAKLMEHDPVAQAMFETLAQEVPDDSCIAWHCSRLQSGATGVEPVIMEK
jgi:adenylate cyclase